MYLVIKSVGLCGIKIEVTMSLNFTGDKGIASLKMHRYGTSTEPDRSGFPFGSFVRYRFRFLTVAYSIF